MKKHLSVLAVIFVTTAILSGCGGSPTTSSQSPQAQSQKAAEKPSVKTYKPGQYKVGADLPAGEYVAIADGNGYIEIAKNSTGTLDSILANDLFQNRSIISVSDGQFLKIQKCVLYALKDAPKVKDVGGFLPPGMYKVGVDLPAGEYKIISEAQNSYIETSRTSRHTLDDIIANDLFQGDKYVNVSNGQYVKFVGAKIKVK
ncbi:MAG: hypothetical protein RIN56_00110 [Sporomusaceae bacterium]|nr:hypothetical protein [Sporomusaceae bacterium]